MFLNVFCVIFIDLFDVGVDGCVCCLFLHVSIVILLYLYDFNFLFIIFKVVFFRVFTEILAIILFVWV
ncbi:hypothetical protein C9I88_08395 [Photobacterium iliopiscarium]|uniref:Uncharacterized protein n=1 Tax=Photobacterium iliopiscarium TaxID=56192 RepID=A0A2T3MLH8_9GAMM|nr:hypothetical protein C9I88_08395 [Photobacterium iliopiscarium]